MNPYFRILLTAATLATPLAQAGQIVSNLTEPYSFSAGLFGVYVQASSFTTSAEAYRLDSVTLDLQVNQPGTVALSLFTDNGGVPGVAIENLGTQFINASGGDYDTVYPASGTTVLQPNTRYWLVVEQTGGNPNNGNQMSIQWVSTTSTAETSPVGVTIGDDMYQRLVGDIAWTPTEIGPGLPTDAGQFAINATQVKPDRIVSNLTQPYNFSAGLGGVFTMASSFTMASLSRILGGVTVPLQANQPGEVSAGIFSDAGGLPGSVVENLGAQAISDGFSNWFYPASGTTQLQPNTTYWLLVQQTVGQSIQWASTLSTLETSDGGETIGNDMYYRTAGNPPTWTAIEVGPGLPTDTGLFSIHGTTYAVIDVDEDEIPDSADNCPNVANPDQANDDGDSLGNVCDNCPTVTNQDQANGDGDAIGNVCDNCSALANTGQCDSDADGFGNRCDGDLNSSNFVNAQDYVLFRQQLGQPSNSPTYNKADFNCNGGAVNAQDYVLFRGLLGLPPGPSGLACAGTVPCP